MNNNPTAQKPKNMEKRLTYLAFALITAAALTACKKDKDEDPPADPPNEAEVLTTLILTFTDQEVSTEVFEMRFSDPDGNDGNPPVIVADTLPASRAYNMAVRVLNESASPAVEITNEIASEALAHQFFFRADGSTLSITYADADANGQPVGLSNTAVTGAAGNGTLTVTLRHQPDKSAAGVSSGDITNAGGETDIEVEFLVVIE